MALVRGEAELCEPSPSSARRRLLEDVKGRLTSRELGADRVAEEKRDTATGLLVERDLEGATDGVLARVDEAGEDEREALLVPRGVRLAENLDDGLVREPVGDGLRTVQRSAGCVELVWRESIYSSGLQAVAELGSTDVEGLDTGGDLVTRLVVVGGGNVGHLREESQRASASQVVSKSRTIMKGTTVVRGDQMNVT